MLPLYVPPQKALLLVVPEEFAPSEQLAEDPARALTLLRLLGSSGAYLGPRTSGLTCACPELSPVLHTVLQLLAPDAPTAHEPTALVPEVRSRCKHKLSR